VTGATGPIGATGAGFADGDSINGGTFTAGGSATTAPTLIRFKRGTAGNLTLANPLLDSGEPCFETDTGRLKIGDGVTYWTTLPYIN
jgi:hypothetical protein